MKNMFIWDQINMITCINTLRKIGVQIEYLKCKKSNSSAPLVTLVG